MRRKTIFWIEPDDDDYQLAVDIFAELNIDLQLVRHYRPQKAINRFRTVEAGEVPSMIVTEYNDFWRDELRELDQIVGVNTIIKVPVILFSDYMLPHIVRFLPHARVIQKPSNYDELVAIIKSLVEEIKNSRIQTAEL